MPSLGTYSWGYDQIIAADPEVRGENSDGSPHAHAMCDAQASIDFFSIRVIGVMLGGKPSRERAMQTECKKLLVILNRNMRIMQVILTAALAMAGIGTIGAAESPGLASMGAEKDEWAKLEGQPVNMAPWAYAWRADRAVQEKPEAYFIPRRLERIDKVYRTASTALPPDQLKSLYYNMPDLLKRFPPPPKGRLQAGLLWTGGLSKYRVCAGTCGSAREERS